MALTLTVADHRLLIAGSMDRFTLGTPELHTFPKISKEVIIDLTNVKNTDTAGLAWLLTLIAFYQQRNLQVTVANEPQQLIALASISNVLNLIPLRHS